MFRLASFPVRKPKAQIINVQTFIVNSDVPRQSFETLRIDWLSVCLLFNYHLENILVSVTSE